MNNNGKEIRAYCPLLSAAAGSPTKCIREECAWWDEDADLCAVGLLAFVGLVVRARWRDGDVVHYFLVKEA